MRDVCQLIAETDLALAGQIVATVRGVDLK